MDPELDSMIDTLINLTLVIGLLAVIQQMAFLMPETGTGAESYSELPDTAQIAQTHWNPQEKALYVYLPDHITPRTEVR